MYIPQITPIEGIDELLKVVSKSDLWTERLTELKELQQWINDNLEILGTLEDAKKLESKAKALVKGAGETRSQADNYAVEVKGDADKYALKIRHEFDDVTDDATRRLESVRDEEQAIDKRLAEVTREQEQLAKGQVDLEKQQRRTADIRVEAEGLKREYLGKLAAMAKLAS